MGGEGKTAEEQGEDTFVVLGAAGRRWAGKYSAHHVQTTLLPSSHGTLREALFHGPSRGAPQPAPCPPPPTPMLSLTLVCQHFLLQAVWLLTPENPLVGSRLSCPAQGVLALWGLSPGSACPTWGGLLAYWFLLANSVAHQ